MASSKMTVFPEPVGALTIMLASERNTYERTKTARVSKLTTLSRPNRSRGTYRIEYDRLDAVEEGELPEDASVLDCFNEPPQRDHNEDKKRKGSIGDVSYGVRRQEPAH